MSRYRKVLTRIWQDDKFPFLDPDAQRLFFYQLTSPHSTPFLLYVEGAGSQSDVLRLPLRRIIAARRRLETIGLSWYDPNVTNLICLPNALKQKENAPESDKAVAAWVGLFADLPRSTFLDRCLAHWQGMTIPNYLTKKFLDAVGTRTGDDGSTRTASNNSTSTATAEGTNSGASRARVQEQEQEQEQEKEKSRGSAAPAPLPAVEAFQLAEVLRSAIAKRDPKSKAARNSDEALKWAHDIDALIRIDGRDPPTIRAVIAWVQTPGCFWAGNILSGKKLREKFDTLYAQMTERVSDENRCRSDRPDAGRNKPFPGAPEYIPRQR